MPTSPLDLARILAQEYGHPIDPLNYILGVAVSGAAIASRASRWVACLRPPITPPLIAVHPLLD